jgi:hypothetical protein
MKDIGTLDSRITNLEYYQALTLLEKKASDMTVTDVNGLNRFKNGIFVDTFNNFTKSEVSNPEFKFSINTVQGRGRPRIIRETNDVRVDNIFSTITEYINGLQTVKVLDSSNGIEKTGRLITLPYTEVSHLTQPYATKYRSSAHVSMAWNGNIRLIPQYDNHNDTKNTGSINITVDLTTPWKEFAASPFGSIWGDWNTQTSVTSKTVRTGQAEVIDTVDLGNLGGFFGGGGGNNAENLREAKEAALAKIHEKYGQNVVIGKFNLTYGPPV